MNQIILQKDEKRLIPVLLGDSPYSSSEAQCSREVPYKRGGSPQGRTISEASLRVNERVDIILVGENAQVEVWGLVIGGKVDQKSIEINITHAAPGTKSKVNVRAVMRGRSKFDFRGNVRIEKGAKGADAYLRSDALLFDEAKMGDDTPALEILERDVRAGHAATVGKVDEWMLFYLMSRGLTRHTAEKLLVEGFVGPIMDKIRNPKHEIRNK